MRAANENQRIGHRRLPQLVLWTYAKAEISLRSVRLHRQNAPYHLVCAGGQGLERHAQLRAVTPVDACLSRLHRGAFLITHLDSAEGRLALVGGPEHHLFWRSADRAPDGGARPIKMSVRESVTRRSQYKEDGGD